MIKVILMGTLLALITRVNLTTELLSDFQSANVISCFYVCLHLDAMAISLSPEAKSIGLPHLKLSASKTKSYINLFSL